MTLDILKTDISLTCIKFTESACTKTLQIHVKLKSTHMQASTPWTGEMLPLPSFCMSYTAVRSLGYNKVGFFFFWFLQIISYSAPWLVKSMHLRGK